MSFSAGGEAATPVMWRPDPLRLADAPIRRFVAARRAEGVALPDDADPALYPALHDLENKGLLDSYERTEKGRIRRYYKLTHKGRKKLVEERKEWKSLSGAVELVLEGART